MLVMPANTGVYFGRSMTANDFYTILGSYGGTSGLTGNGGPATSALLSLPDGVALDALGNVYFADSDNNRIQMVAVVSGTYFGQVMTANDIYTIAGNAAGSFGTSGDGGTATAALLEAPYGLALDPWGNLYIADTSNDRIQMVPKTSGTWFGQVMTANDMYTVIGSVAGTAGHTGDGGAAMSALLSGPEGVYVDGVGNLFIADTSNNRVQMVPKTSGTNFGQVMTLNDVYTIAGSKTGASGLTGDGGPATSALLQSPRSVALDSTGNLYIADLENNRIQMVPKVAATYFNQVMAVNDMYTIAGSATGAVGFSGDGGPASSALLDYPYVVALDSSNNLYFIDQGNNNIQMVPVTSGTYFGQSMTANDIYTIAGTAGDFEGYTGNNGPATSALMNQPTGLALDASGNLYIGDTYNNVIRIIWH